MKTTANIKPAERDREQTEQRLLDSLGEMVRERGFEQIGINAVAARSGISKILIYRYFGSVEGLMAAYLRRHDFWINFQHEIPENQPINTYVKAMFREQIRNLRADPVLRRLSRWELSTDNAMVTELRTQREAAGLERVRQVCARSGRSIEEVAPLATLLSAAPMYLALLGEFCPAYNGIPLGTDQGWEQICGGIDALVDQWFGDSV